MSRFRDCIQVLLRRRLILTDLTLSRVYSSYKIQCFVLELKCGHVYTSPVGLHEFAKCVLYGFVYFHWPLYSFNAFSN
jgi:hypothetical protein